MHVEEHEPLDELRSFARREADARIARRMQAVVLARCGKTAPQIAEATGMSRRPIQAWVARYNRDGVTGLRGRPHPGKPPRLTAEQQRQLREKIDGGADYDRDGVCVLRGQDVRDYIAEHFGVVYHLNHVYKLLGGLGYGSLKPRPRHKKADPAKQTRWLADAPLFKPGAGPACGQGRTSVVSGRSPLRPAGHADPGLGPHRLTPDGGAADAIRLAVVSAFVCPETGEALGAMHPDLNAARVGQLLDAFSRHLPAGEHAVLVWDNAGFHTAGAIRVPPNVTLLPLPPYSPELNPVENLWHYLRSHHGSNRSFADYDALMAAACRAWDAVSSNADSIRTICATPVI